MDKLDLIETILKLWKQFKGIAQSTEFSALGLSLNAEFCYICTESYIEKLKQTYKIKR